MTDNSLSVNSLRGLSADEISQVVADWVENCSSPAVSAAIAHNDLEQIKFYERKYQTSSSDIKAQAEVQEFVSNQEISHWLMLIDSYPECLEEGDRQ